MSPWLLYVIFVLPQVANAVFALAMVAGIVLAIASVILVVESKLRMDSSRGPDDADAVTGRALLAGVRQATWGIVVCAIVIVATSAVPDERAMYAIVGGYAVTNIDGVERLGPNFVRAANAFLEQYQAEVGGDE